MKLYINKISALAKVRYHTPSVNLRGTPCIGYVKFGVKRISFRTSFIALNIGTMVHF